MLFNEKLVTVLMTHNFGYSALNFQYKNGLRYSMNTYEMLFVDSDIRDIFIFN